MRDKKYIAHSSPKSTRSKVCEYSAKVTATEELKKLKSNGRTEDTLTSTYTPPMQISLILE